MTGRKHTPGPWRIVNGMMDTLRIEAGLPDINGQTVVFVHLTDDKMEETPDGTLHRKVARKSARADARLIAAAPCLLEALEGLVNTKALKGVRELVAGWNGENRPEGPHASRHPGNLGATLPKTNCGAVYALDEAMERARAAIARAKGEE